MPKPNILLTNDDGILSPGLWAAAAALSHLGFVTVAAPKEQASGTGRSLPSTSSGRIHEEIVTVGGQPWKVYAIDGTPAQAVEHGILEIMPQRPDLVVSGINYGENVANGITISGTVGAAMEAASLGIPALAMSLQMEPEHNLSYSTEIDFSAAAHFTALFSRLLLDRPLPGGVDLIKVDVPAAATPHTPWEWTEVSQERYYIPLKPDRTSWQEPTRIGYKVDLRLDLERPNSDVYIINQKRHVSATPLTLNMTARVDGDTLNNFARQSG